jgi:hypothetical protein
MDTLRCIVLALLTVQGLVTSKAIRVARTAFAIVM